jgi:acetylglutamate kinase
MDQHCFVIKCGGSTLSALSDAFYAELCSLHREGWKPVIVHGGGPAISEALEKFGIETEFVGGLRKTTEPVLDIVEMVLAGSINKEVVRRILRAGGSAIGLSGTDGNLLRAEKIKTEQDIGFVGEVEDVNVDLIRMLLENGHIPVVAPVGIGADGQRYNINADTAAGAVASALGVTRLIVVTDVPGILKPVGQNKELVPVATERDIQEMIDSGVIYGGMIPKVKAALKCLHGDVKEVVIVDGGEEGVLGRLLNGEKIGTRIVRE